MKNTFKLENQSRRDFFIKMALGGIALTLPPMVLSGCEEELKYQGTGKVPFKIWEEMLQAIKTSPDYLPQRVEDVIATKDPKAMYDFVKNEIVLMPTTKNAIAYYNLGNGIKWGLKGVLRCGMATPREKVELLHQMYTKAGISSKVVYERTGIKAEDVPSFFYRPINREFKPKISKSQLKTWRKAMGDAENEAEQKAILVDYSNEAKDLARSIEKALPKIDDFGAKFSFKWDNSKTPTVEFTHKSEVRYAHLFDPKTPFGEKHNSATGKTVAAQPIKENKEKVSLKITYRDTVNHKIVKDLITGEWNLIDLIGKQIQLNFLHGLTFEEQLVTPISSLRTFTPTLALQAINNDLAFAEKRSFIADPITIDGKRIPLSEGENRSLNGNEIQSKPHPNLQKEVATLELKATASSYPIVKLSVDAKDASDNRIEGLSATDFKITDNGKPVKALLENNQRTPKILVLSDSSSSMPIAYRNEGIKKFNASLSQKIKENYPAANIIFWKTPSTLFTWLLKASQTAYDLILFATDGHNNDHFEEKNLSVYNSGPPAIILNVYDYKSGGNMETFNKMAEITNGMVLNAKNQEKVLEEVTDYIEKMALSPYVFTFASADKTKPHTVAVSLDNERLKATANYTFPMVELAQKNGISGIYLELKVGRSKAIKRVLAGWDPIVELYNQPDDKNLAAVQQLLLGGVMLAVEGEGPTMAVALADVLKSKLSNRLWGEAYLDNDIKKATQELSKGSIHIPGVLIPMLGPLQDQVTTKSLTYPNGYRMCLLKTMVGINKASEFTFDYLPTSDYQTMAKDKKERFLTTLEKTAQLAVREGTLFEQSTITSLHNSKLIDTKTAYKQKWFNEFIGYRHKDAKYWRKVLNGEYGYTKIFDATASSKSFWRLGQWSGELYGIMPDGSGGGGNTMKKQLDDLSLVIDTILMGAMVAGAGSPGLSVVGSFKKTEAQLWALACLSITVMDTSGMNKEIIKAMQELACNVLKEIALIGLPGKFADTIGSVEYLIGLMGGKSPFSC